MLKTGHAFETRVVQGFNNRKFRSNNVTLQYTIFYDSLLVELFLIKTKRVKRIKKGCLMIN